MTMTQEQCERIFGGVIGGMFAAGARIVDVKAALQAALASNQMWTIMTEAQRAIDEHTPNAAVLSIVPKEPPP